MDIIQAKSSLLFVSKKEDANADEHFTIDGKTTLCGQEINTAEWGKVIEWYFNRFNKYDGCKECHKHIVGLFIQQENGKVVGHFLSTLNEWSSRPLYQTLSTELLYYFANEEEAMVFWNQFWEAYQADRIVQCCCCGSVKPRAWGTSHVGPRNNLREIVDYTCDYGHGFGTDKALWVEKKQMSWDDNRGRFVTGYPRK